MNLRWPTLLLMWFALPSHVAATPTTGTAETPPVACRFETTVAWNGGSNRSRTSAWYLWRAPDRVETRVDGRGETWWRGTRGTVHYQRVFHEERRVIDYTPGDLRALDAASDWDRLTHVIDPRSLGRELKPAGSATVLGRRALRYRGTLDGVALEVLWLERERIPARVRQRHPDRTVTLRLMEIYPIARAPWPRANTVDYVATDYADIGDHESDPFLRRVLNEAGAAHAH